MRGLDGFEVSDGLGRLGGGGEDGAGVVLQELEPLREVLRMVGADILRDAKLGTEERAADLGDQFFGGIGGIAKALAEFAVEAVLGAGPVKVSCARTAKYASERVIVSVPQNRPSSGIWM